MTPLLISTKPFKRASESVSPKTSPQLRARLASHIDLGLGQISHRRFATDPDNVLTSKDYQLTGPDPCDGLPRTRGCVCVMVATRAEIETQDLHVDVALDCAD